MQTTRCGEAKIESEKGVNDFAEWNVALLRKAHKN
jgi:hypothetical protein